jgi:hypothetical protein
MREIFRFRWEGDVLIAVGAEESLEVERRGDLDHLFLIPVAYAEGDGDDTAGGRGEEEEEEEEDDEEEDDDDEEEKEEEKEERDSITRCWSEMTPCCAATACLRSWMAARNRGT